jgi:Xaa-Pro aminopeptidase
LDKNWQLVKAGLPESPTRETWLCSELKKGAKIGVDPSLISFELVRKWQCMFDKKGIEWKPISKNLIDAIWTQDRPARPTEFIMPLEEGFAGVSSRSKIDKVREVLVKNQLEGLIVSALDDIAWTLNCRGKDIPFNPVFFAYFWITCDKNILYIDEAKIPDMVR